MSVITRWSLLTCLALLLCACGGHEGESDRPSGHEVVQQAEEAVAAAEEDELETAEAALAKARLLATRLAKHPPEVQTALSEADHALALARERAELRRLLRGLKPRSYAMVREPTLKVALLALGSAAKLADDTVIDSIPQPARAQAQAAADMVRALFPAKGPVKNWPAVAGRLNNLDKDAPQFRMLLALTWLLCANDRLALAEIAQTDANALEDPHQRLALLAIRSCVYQVNGLRLLAAEDVAAIESAVGPQSALKPAPEQLAGLYLVLAVVAMLDDDLDAADGYLVRAGKLWPNNPVCVYLTGEVIAADGNREAAAVSLETAARGSDHEQVARLLAQRARQLRDGKDGEERLLDQRALLIALIREELKIAANIDATRTISDWFTAAGSLGPRMLDYFKLGGEDAQPDPKTIEAERPANWAVPITDRPGLGNFHKITDNLYRGEQPTPEGFDQLKKLGVKTVINLRTFHSDRAQCERVGLDYVHINMQAWEGEDDEVIEFLKVATDPKRQPVFFHCQHGADRTGTMGAAYRMIVQDWTREDALKEMTDGGYGFHAVWQNLISYINKMDVDRIKSAVTPAAPTVATE